MAFSPEVMMFLELRTITGSKELSTNFSVLPVENLTHCVLSPGLFWRNSPATPVCFLELYNYMGLRRTGGNLGLR